MVGVVGLEPTRVSPATFKAAAAAITPYPQRNMPRQYRNYSDQDIIDLSRSVTSISALLKALNLKPCGGNYENMKRKLQYLQVDTSHWSGQAWSKDQKLKDWSQYTRNADIKKHLLKERGRVCQRCKLSLWLNQPITIELEHIDGDRTNMNPDNLLLLCPNCHSLTSTWKRGKMVVHEGIEPSSPG